MPTWPFEAINTPLESPRREGKEEREKGRRERESLGHISSSKARCRTVFTWSKLVPKNSRHQQGPNPLEKRGTLAKTPSPKRPPARRTGRRQIGQKATFFAPEQTDRPVFVPATSLKFLLFYPFFGFLSSELNSNFLMVRPKCIIITT